jgi:UDP-N-acetylmuramoyl-tripeptide--D-alanyl-D-alanine ligase
MATPIPPNHARMTVDDILAATAGVRRHAPSGPVAVEGVTTDSRAVTPGSAFVALRGEAHDGHDFVGRAAAGGARVVVVEAGRALDVAVPGLTVVEVDDTLRAWGALGRAHLRAWRREPRRTVAITGSAGKTTTKELCASLLGLFGRCHATPGNLNNRVGVPAVALGVTGEDRFAVFEVGMSLPGEIGALAQIIEPDVAVLLNIGVAHAGGVGGTRADVAREKGALLEALDASACAVVNADDEAAVSQVARTRARHVVTFGRAAGAHYRLVERVASGEAGSHVVLEVPRGSGRARIEVDLPLPGEPSAIDLVAALAAAEAASALQIAPTVLAEAVARASSVAGRAAVRRLPGDIVVLDDTYNANPASMRSALHTLDEIARPAGRRTVAVLGEMKELGPLGPREHELLGDELVQHHLALVIGCGGLIDLALERASRGGTSVARADDTAAAARLAVDLVRPGDAVLLKGSRAAAVEHVWNALEQKHGSAHAVGGRR